MEVWTWLNREELGPEVNIPDTADDGGDNNK